MSRFRTGTLAAPILLLALVFAWPATARQAAEPPATPVDPPDTAVETDDQPVSTLDQSAAETPQGSFAEVINVKVVNVYVYVRDKKTGEPITGLTKDDFRLFEDKKEIPITNFYEVASGSRVGEEALPKQTQLERIKENPDVDPRISQVPADQRLWMVIYVDHFNIRPVNRNRVFRYVRDFIRDNVGPEDRVMVASYNRSLKIDRTFTRDPQLISRALMDMEKHTGGRTQLDSDRKDLLRDFQNENQDAGIMGARVKLFAESQYNDLQFTLDAMKQMVNMLGGIPGRKALVYVSDGLPMRAGEDMFIAASEFFPDELQNMRMESMQYDAGRRYRDIAAMAAANQVAFYTIDANGLLGRSDRGADVGPYHASAEVESAFQSNMQQPLQFLADYTGGQSIVNTNNFDGGFQRISVDFGNYYSLGYSPAHAGSGREYKLEVEVKNRKGISVRTRDSYRDKPLETEMAEGTLASLQFGIEQNDLRLRLVEKDSIRRNDGTYMVHVDVQIPLDQIELVPRGDMHEGRVRLWVQAGDSDGRLSDVTPTTVPIEVRDEDIDKIEGKYWVFTLPLQMREGDQRLAISARDDVGAKTSFITRTMRVGG